ncbi:stage III sporulation protein AE [Mangrovibacillus cuniculi]|uniref:Stage III sporulation protein AE n=1 Tax=Mangrovibacillus cuniculi TaxID=2593652 RepID=A0A7S8CBC0_9BACI|nr:stage III sporulation protein AE [Mangrovibacillus cuniculi]QPC46831.1 stage III sporulation protein AE [Mangrovibacillus cuniculi]
MVSRRIPIILFTLFLLFFLPLTADANDTTSAADSSQAVQDVWIQEQVEKLRLDELSTYWDEIITDYGGFLPESQKGSLIDFISGEKKFSLDQWFNGLLRFAFHEFLMNGKLLGTLIMLTIFSMFLQSLQNAFENGTISKIAYAIVFIVLMIIALNSFYIAIEYTKDAITSMMGFILALLPLVLALIASSGGLISAAFFHPILVFLMNTSGLLIQHVVLPLLFMAVLLSIVSILSEHHKVTQLASLFRTWSITLLGIFMTVFLGVVSVQGATAAVTDGITIRTAKFVTGNFIPVIGRMFTDAADTVITASVLLKNTVGIAGVAIVLLIAAFPAIKILMIALAYKLAAALLQPLGGGPIIGCLDVISKNIIYVFAALAIVSFMFFLSLTVMIAAGNITMMVR